MATRLNLEVDTNGPFFTGAYQKELMQALDDAKKDVAELGMNRIEDRVSARSKNSRGGYAGSLRTEIVKPFNDQRIHLAYPAVVYGPWIEGTSSRNNTTRFRGYKVFRLTKNWLRKQATPLMQEKIDDFVARMNSGGGA